VEFLPFDDGSVRVLIVAPLMLALIVRGFGTIDATRSDVFYNYERHTADHHQPKRKKRK
jgi:hypothetical protein